MPDQPNRGPFTAYKGRQFQISRRRLYPITAFYGAYSVAIVIADWRTPHRIAGACSLLLGLGVWTLVEYLFHRYVLHGRFPPGKGIIRRFMHDRLDPLHWEHHRRPFDGEHISGQLRDLLPLFVPAVAVSFLLPVYTAPTLLAGVVLGYVAEEWLHSAIHFCNFRNPYFRFIKRYHLYHHSPRGIEQGYGITSGMWDIFFQSQFPGEVRKALARRRAT